MSTAVLLCVQSAVATAADAHTDSGGLHITAHLLHTVQDTSGQWCRGRECTERGSEKQHRVPGDTERGQDKGTTRRSCKHNDEGADDGIRPGEQTATATG